MKFYVFDANMNTITSHIFQGEYESFEKFYDTYQWFENINHSFINYGIAMSRYKDTMERFNDMEISANLDFIHREGIFQNTVILTLCRMYIDNLKSYKRQVPFEYLKKTNPLLSNIEKERDMKLLKALRDYSIHFSLPVKSTTRTFDGLKETSEIDHFILKEDLLKNTENKQNTKVVRNYPSEKIYVNRLIESIEGVMHSLYETVLTDFVEGTPKEIKEILSTYMNIYEANGIQYFPHVFAKETPDYKRQCLGMDVSILKSYMNVLNNNNTRETSVNSDANRN